MFRAIYMLMRIHERDIQSGTKAPIDICINSFGGNVRDGLSLISLIESMKDEGYTINTVNMGYAMSMGFLISIVGTSKKAYRHSVYMNHDMSVFFEGNLESVRQDFEQSKVLREEIKSIIKKYTKISEEELEETYKTKSDRIYTLEEALALGICEEVI